MLKDGGFIILIVGILLCELICVGVSVMVVNVVLEGFV